MIVTIFIGHCLLASSRVVILNLTIKIIYNNVMAFLNGKLLGSKSLKPLQNIQYKNSFRRGGKAANTDEQSSKTEQ